MADLEPITREELLLNSIAGEGSSNLTPITRQEQYLSAIAGETELPSDMKPITREEQYYQKILDNGGAGGGGDEPTGTKEISITQNGVSTHNVKAYASARITTNVPNSYEASDEGKVVSNGALASQTSRNVTANGTYDTTVNDEVVVNVPNPSTGTKQITANGTHDVTDFASAQVNVPNSYSASDEGKVVSNGALVSQTSRQVTANGTYDTTLNNSVEVNVPQGITPTGTKSITTNGTHDVTQYASAEVNVPNPSTGSQTFTENGTYDVTSLAQAVVNVQASGGGVHTKEGYIELTDTNVSNNPSITVPVDLTNATGFVLNMYVVETGEVADGVVTKYDKAEIPTVLGATNTTLIYNYTLKYPRNHVPEVYRDATNLITNREVANAVYNYAYRGNNGANIAILITPTITASGVSFNGLNATRFFCHTGAYVKFKYEVTWW